MVIFEEQLIPIAMTSKKKKKTPPPESTREKDLKEQEYTDKGTIYEEDEFQQYPEVRDEKGIEAGKERNERKL